MLEPQSTALFALLILIFGALVWHIMVGRRVVVRVLAACLAFVTAMVFGVLAVNRYYDYYQTWGAMVADLTHPGRRRDALGARHQARVRDAVRDA
jgi:hypothetical protein